MLTMKGRFLSVTALVTLSATAILTANVAGAADSLLTWDDLRSIKIYHAYSASDGKTYIEEISVPSAERQSGGVPAYLYFDLKPEAVRIARATHGAMIDWHYAGSSRHLIVSMQGDTVFDLGDNRIFRLKAGEAILAEDWTGKGHRSGCQAANGKSCVVIDILLDANPREMPLRAPPVSR